MTRKVGLDILRTLAISLVIVNHSWKFFYNYLDINNVTFFGYIGVDLFFVLSGFLIGRIIIDDLLSNGNISSLKTFYTRRWMRTLPLYYTVLAVLSIFIKPFHWQYLIFIQNFYLDYRFFLGPAWSLSIEEWFYFLTPLLLLFVTRKSHNKKKTFFYFCLMIIIIVAVIRFGFVIKFNPSFDLDIRRNIFLRMDTLMIGVLVAGIKSYYPKIYSKLSRMTLVILPVSILGIFIVWFNYMYGDTNLTNRSFFQRTIGFNVTALSCSLLLISLENLKTKNRFVKKVFLFLSNISYSLYLIHFPIFDYFYPRMQKLSLPLVWMWFILVMAVLLIICGLIYYFFEKPILSYRDKITRKSTKIINVFEV